MKKLLFVLLGLTLAIGVNAQPRWGIKAGGNISKMSWKIGNNKYEGLDPDLGWQAGIIMEYMFTPEFGIQPELLYVNTRTGIKDGAPNANIALNEIQLPVNLKYKMGSNDLKFFISGGAFVSYIAQGKIKNLYGPGINSDIYDNGAFSDDLDMNRINFGVGAGAGFEVKRAIIGVNYQWGLLNITGLSDNKLKTNTLSLSLGYFF